MGCDFWREGVVIDGILVDEVESSPEGDGGKGAEDADVSVDGAVAKGAEHETT